jgi:NADPH:quinone reductase
MKALQATQLTSIDDYVETTLPIPDPGPGQIRVRVAACGVGYVDSLVSLGRYQVKPPLPHIPGNEIAGYVDALGADVSGLALGDRIMANGPGFAEYALAAASSARCIPDAMSFEQAAGFRTNYLTAIHGLKDRACIAPGERLLVIGAAGGVGIAAVQVGRALGATVIGVASSEEKRAFALVHGAGACLDTASEGWRDRLKEATDGHGPDVVFDPVCGPLFELAFRSLRWNGRHLVIGFAGGMPALPVNLPLMKGAALVGVDVRQFLLFEGDRAREHLDTLFDWISDGTLNPPVGRIFPLAEGREALAYALSGKGVGKTVVRI